jgi:carbamate kinase
MLTLDAASSLYSPVMLIVAALGGNAVSLPGKEGNIADQYEATRGAIHPLANLILAGHQLIITHGNGPQIGQVMRRVEIAAQHHVYPLPLDIAVADTQAGMGYMIGQCLMNELALRGSPRVVSTVVTTVRVEENDPAFAKPNKPVGPFMSKEAADAHAQKDGWRVMEDKVRGGWRRVVPSPLPREIVELPQLRTLLADGHVVVAAGGGGIPVARNAYGMFKGIEAVIDKDRTSALLAAALDADLLAILTNVDQVQIDYGKPTARALERITAADLSNHLAAGQFPAGSMGPKVEAAVDFLSQTHKPKAEVLITSCERVADALKGDTGTRVVRA